MRACPHVHTPCTHMMHAGQDLLLSELRDKNVSMEFHINKLEDERDDLEDQKERLEVELEVEHN